MARESEGRQSVMVCERGRGRPKKGSGNGVRLDVRIGLDEQDALEHMIIESDHNKSELVRRAIMLYYRTKKGQW